jgi:hypothetical protein
MSERSKGAAKVIAKQTRNDLVVAPGATQKIFPQPIA